MNDYTGIIHLHSLYSYDGRTPIGEILSAARKANVDFLLLTDHSTMQAREDGFEGWHNGVLLIAGEEIAPRFNHYLAFGHREAIDCAEKMPHLPPQTYIDRVNEKGGFGFIAHPDHKGTRLFHVKNYPWQAWDVTGYTGLGIWDFMTDWQNSLTGYLRAISSYILPAFFLSGPCPETLTRWDTIARTRHVVGIGELDNHDTPKRLWNMTFSVFPFDRVCNVIRTHILTAQPLSGNDQTDIKTIFDALKRGHSYVALDYFRNATGFSMTLQDHDKKAVIGDHFDFVGNALLDVSLPFPAKIRLIKNGVTMQERIGKRLTITIDEPGIYRIEAWLKAWGRYRPWIFGNHIYVHRQG